MRAKNKRHHIIFGRRGSGKSSLIIKSATDLVKEGNPVVYIDLEPFKQHKYPDVVISVLIVIIGKLKSYLENIEVKPYNARKFWFEFWKPKFNYRQKQRNDLVSELDRIQKDLFSSLHGGEVKKISETKTKDQQKSNSFDFGGSVEFSEQNPLGVNAKFENQVAKKTMLNDSTVTSVEFEQTKKELLNTIILSLRDLISKCTKFSNRPFFVFLDDLYHIKIENQATLIDYIHRILKGNNGFLKIGTIKARSNWYIHSPQPIGLKLGDDADEISLDRTLEKFSSTKTFLGKILNEYNCKVNGSDATLDIISPTGEDRLVLASGGVTRDFLGLFRRAVEEAKERLTNDKKHHRGPKIAAEDVNLASGAYGETKREEFQRDTDENTNELEEAFEKIKTFCLEVIKKNIFLVSMDAKGKNFDLLQELIDLRLVHQVKSRVTTTTLRGELFKAYLLDFSQYTGERLRRDVEMIDFWKTANKDKIRIKSMIYNPNLSLEEIKSEIKKTK